MESVKLTLSDDVTKFTFRFQLHSLQICFFFKGSTFTLSWRDLHSFVETFFFSCAKLFSCCSKFGKKITAFESISLLFFNLFFSLVTVGTFRTLLAFFPRDFYDTKLFLLPFLCLTFLHNFTKWLFLIYFYCMNNYVRDIFLIFLWTILSHKSIFLSIGWLKHFDIFIQHSRRARVSLRARKTLSLSSPEWN